MFHTHCCKFLSRNSFIILYNHLFVSAVFKNFVWKFTAKDFTFSKQIKGKPVPFGEAGDCYSNSKRGCPQGRFSIDLSGTGMKISHDTTWVGKGSNTSFWVNKIEVTIQRYYYYICCYRHGNLFLFSLSKFLQTHVLNTAGMILLFTLNQTSLIYNLTLNHIIVITIFTKNY